MQIVLRLEAGQFFSSTARKIYHAYHDVEIGKYTYGSCFSPNIWPRGTRIGRYCSIAGGVRVFRRNHPVSILSQHPFFYNSSLGLLPSDMIPSNEDNPLIIGNDVWIGDGVTILPGCKSIGDGAIIGAASVVTKDVESFSIIAGNPAKVIRKRFSEKVETWAKYNKWWEMELEDLLAADQLLFEVLEESSLHLLTTRLIKNTDVHNG